MFACTDGIIYTLPPFFKYSDNDADNPELISGSWF